MTEEEWLGSTELSPMLEFLCGKASDRKLSLFMVAICRMNWELLYDNKSREMVDLAERYVDGLATDWELKEGRYWAESPTFGQFFEPAVWKTFVEPEEVPEPVKRLLEMGIVSVKDIEENRPINPWVQERLLAAANLAESCVSKNPLNLSVMSALSTLNGPKTVLIRCIFGSLPFRTVALDPLWSIWNDCTIRKLAEAIYDERAFDRLSILADALEEAGCEDTDILNHCRSEGPHVRGCWVVDLLLGKS